MSSATFSFSDVCSYNQMNYWDERYMKFPYCFEWYCKYDDLKQILFKYCPKDGKILVVGCGNSELSLCMHEDGFSAIHNIDFSRVVIDQMSIKYKSKTMKWTQMVCTDISFQAEEFDCVIDKGTLDCVFCSNEVHESVKKYCDEVERVLNAGFGKWIIISGGGSIQSRLEYLENDRTSFDVKVFGIQNPSLCLGGEKIYKTKTVENENYFVYVCEKNKKKAEEKARMHAQLRAQEEARGKIKLSDALKEIEQK